jgi:hypothetical protein
MTETSSAPAPVVLVLAVWNFCILLSFGCDGGDCEAYGSFWGGGMWLCVLLHMSVHVSEKQTVTILFSEYGARPESEAYAYSI